MTRTTTSNRASPAVYVVEGEGERAFWIRIGPAWAHEDGDGPNLQLSCLPLTGVRLLLTPGVSQLAPPRLTGGSEPGPRF